MKVVIAGGREVVALALLQGQPRGGSCPLEGEAIFQLKLATGMGFQLCPQNKVLLRNSKEASLVLNWTALWSALWAHTPWPCGGYCVSAVCLHVSRGH